MSDPGSNRPAPEQHHDMPQDRPARAEYESPTLVRMCLSDTEGTQFGLVNDGVAFRVS